MSKQSFKKVLVTGFEPFDQDLVNPSQNLLKYLSLQKFDLMLSTLCLPVTFKESSEILLNEIEQINPDIVLMTGLAKNRSKISLEKIAINWIDARIPDNNGLLPLVTKIDFKKPDGLFTSIDLNRALSFLNNPNFEISYSAGTYVCNYVYYKVLSTCDVPAIFVHLPMPNQQLNEVEVFKLITNLIHHL